MISFFVTFAHAYRSLVMAVALATSTVNSSPVAAQLPSIANEPIDLVVVFKKDRVLHLKSKGRIVRQFEIALGGEPEGHKLAEEDHRTPEGVYTLDWRNTHSQFYKSIHISYPQERDEEAAARLGVSPGGLIMIHGMPNGREVDEMNHPINDWTNGCIAVTNDEMDEIWSLVEDGTTIIIFP